MKRRKNFYWVVLKSDTQKDLEKNGWDIPDKKGWTIAYWDGKYWQLIGLASSIVLEDKAFIEIMDDYPVK